MRADMDQASKQGPGPLTDANHEVASQRASIEQHLHHLVAAAVIVVRCEKASHGKAVFLLSHLAAVVIVLPYVRLAPGHALLG